MRRVTLDLKEMTQDDIESALLADDLDVGIAFAGSHLPGIVATTLFTETLSLVTGTPDRRDGPARPLPVHDLVNHRLALLNGDFATRSHVDAHFAAHRVRPSIAVEADSVQALVEIVRRTPVSTVLADAVTHDHPHLHPVPLEPPLPARTVTLLRRESSYQSAAARAFTRLAHDVVRARGYTDARQ
ncbi:LysR substrate-binding domain-containing protein [Streptomyces sp. NPDC048297]|uniref:LysR substrate-binding domain-containing protein n=1 Tax=Streptomyces sp. NPDC048297 TaxID=3365531 RepID=UPI003719CEE5